MSEETARARARAVVALVLCFVAGAVDAVGYVVLDHTLLANMSGNTLHVAVNSARQEWSSALRYLWPVALFTVGLVLSGLFHSLGKRRGFSSLRTALLVEAALLVAVWWLGTRVFLEENLSRGLGHYVLSGLGALAMGLQNASLTHVGPLSVYTTHITGSLTKFSETLVEALFRLTEARRRQPQRGWRHAVREALSEERGLSLPLMSGLWLCFLGGGVAGAAAWLRWGLGGLWIPLVLLAGVVLYDWHRSLEGGGAQ